MWPGDAVAELAERWIALKERTITARTVTGYRDLIDNHINPRLGEHKAAKLRGHHIDRMYDNLAAAGVGTATIVAAHRVLRAMFNQAVRWELVDRNPTAAASPPRHRSKPITPPTLADLETGLTRLATIDPDMAVYATVAASTGARRGEMCALRWTDIDQINAAITISGAVTRGPDNEWVHATTKTGTVHTVAIGSDVLTQLTAMHRRHTLQCTRLGITPSRYVFQPNPTRPSTPPRPDSWTQRWTRRRNDIGLHGVRLHDLRHYTATMLLAAGVDPVTVAGRLGHSNPAITMKVYAAFLPEKDREAANILDQALTGSRRLKAVPD